MTDEEARKRIEQLKREIDYHRRNYHVYDRETLSPEALDELKHELAQLESQYPQYITLDSPTQRVGGEVLEAFEQYIHQVPMKSLSDVFNKQELANWMKRNQSLLPDDRELDYFVELKLDGLAISLHYDHEELIRGVTRGNGTQGEVVTHNVKTIEDIPLTLDLSTENFISLLDKYRAGWGGEFQQKYHGQLEVRGEVYVRFSEFDRINHQRRENQQQPFANTRNMAAGSLRQLDSRVAARRPLRFFAWSCVTDLGQRTQAEEQYLLNLLFPVLTETCCTQSLKEIEQFKDRMYQKRDIIDFAYDGLVIKVNDKHTQQELGFVGKGPRFMIAYKFPAEEKTSQVQDIRIQIGRTGKVTPVAILKPIEVYGVTVSQVSLHNQDEIDRLDLRIGDTVVVRRAGDVIPEIVQTLPGLRPTGTQPFEIPDTCPWCGHSLRRQEGYVAHFCLNPHCPARVLGNLSYMVSQEAFDIRGLSHGVLQRLINAGLIESEGDIFTLKEEDIASLPGFGQKSATKLIHSIESSKTISFSRFLQSLGIPHVGKQTAEILANNFQNIIELETVSPESLETIPDIGPIVAQAIYQFFQNPSHQEKIQRLFTLGVTIEYPDNFSDNQFLHGKSFVLTGTFAQSRKDLQDLIIRHGGQIKSSVTKNVDYVVYGESPGSKYQKAQKLGIDMITEDRLRELLNIN